MRFLDWQKLYTDHQDEYDTVIKRALLGGKHILQEDVEEFEKKFADYIGVKHAIGVASGTDALWLSLKASGIGPGDEVITVSHTFIATIEVINRVGAKPVLVDIGEDGLMDMSLVHKKINKNTKAIIPVHLSGDVCDMDNLDQILKHTNIIVIEDAAQAVGASRYGKKAGSWGTTGCFSFYPAKILGTFGDGGAITTNDDYLAEEFKRLRNHYKPTYELHGYNSRLDNVWAAVLNVKLDHVEYAIRDREFIANKYMQGLKDTIVKLPDNRIGRVWQDFVIRTNQRDELSAWLNKNEIETLGGEPANHSHEMLGLDFNLPKTDEYAANSIRIPCNQYMTIKDAEEVINLIKQYSESWTQSNQN